MTNQHIEMRSMSKMHMDDLKPSSQRPDGRTKKPLRTFKELAVEFDISVNWLTRSLARSTIKVPEPVLRNRAGFWYDPAAMRAWWKAHNESLDVKA